MPVSGREDFLRTATATAAAVLATRAGWTATPDKADENPDDTVEAKTN